MSGAISASTLMVAGAAMAGGMILAKSMAKTPMLPQLQKPEAPVQAAQQAAQTTIRQANKGFMPGGPAAGGTLLTGGAGVTPDALALGRNTLLGQ